MVLRSYLTLNCSGLFQLIFVAVRGGDYRSDIAIDDVSIHDGLCPVSHTCSFQQFEASMCGYLFSTKVFSSMNVNVPIRHYLQRRKQTKNIYRIFQLVVEIFCLNSASFNFNAFVLSLSALVYTSEIAFTAITAALNRWFE